MQSVKNENRTLLLYLLNSYGALSRKEIAAKLGLTPAAVTKICTALIRDGYVKESGEINEKGKMGRKGILLSLCLDEKAVCGITAEKDGITLSVSALSGRLTAKERIPFTADIASVSDAALAFLKRTGYQHKITAAGVCIIGSQSENDFGIWKNENLKEAFETALSVPVVIENNVQAFAQSELLYGEKKNTSSVLFLKWGPGIGSAIVVSGKVFSGNDSSVAEIGHYIVNRGGAKCRCGRYGCLETEADESAIQKELGLDLPLDEILRLRDNSVISTIDQKIDMVALALTNTATILNADNIVLFGTMFHKEQIAQKLIKQCLRYNSNLTDEMISISKLNENSDYIGACAICAKQYFFESEE